MANTAVGLAVLLGPICLAVIVLVAIEMTDRIPFPEAGASQARPPTRRLRLRKPPRPTIRPAAPSAIPSAALALTNAAVRPKGATPHLRRVK